eukprot:TRINITY_DN63232_c0_g1_i1.p1 TRINITY_DN63232_c0_g1~~TRINITY_DN63232_c0_g1_i1.p1  ORF type:complete len:294 (-),score=78.78 TRINITY_DN63232_c0_g1_i1:47-928(-)
MGPNVRRAMSRATGVAALAALLFAAASAQGPPGGTTVEAPRDMGCTEGPRAEAWRSVKLRMHSLFNTSTGPFKLASIDALAEAVQGSIAEIQPSGGFAAESAGECGFGKLFLQVLSMTLMDSPEGLAQFLQEHPTLSSPVMTALLDIPWTAVAQSGWPLFGVLAQVNYKKLEVLGPVLNYDAIDGLGDDAVRKYFEVMGVAQKQGDLVGMAQASTEFLQKAPQSGGPLSTLTALATQAAVQMNVQRRFELLGILQQTFRETVTSAATLDIALTTRWPLWGFLHVAADVFADVA